MEIKFETVNMNICKVMLVLASILISNTLCNQDAKENDTAYVLKKIEMKPQEDGQIKIFTSDDLKEFDGSVSTSKCEGY